jgi:hypothetical protein
MKRFFIWIGRKLGFVATQEQEDKVMREQQEHQRLVARPTNWSCFQEREIAVREKPTEVERSHKRVNTANSSSSLIDSTPSYDYSSSDSSSSSSCSSSSDSGSCGGGGD